MTNHDYTRPSMLPVIIDAPGVYVTRCGELVTIDRVSDSYLKPECYGVYSTGQRDSWHSTGRIFENLLSDNDIVSKLP